MKIDKIYQNWPSLLIGLLISALLITTFPPASITAAPIRMQPYLVTLAQETPDEQVSIIVQKTTADTGLEGLVMRLGGKITRALSIINAFAAQIQADFLLPLAQAPGVRWISLDAPVYKSNAIADGSVQVRDEFKTFDYTGNDGTHAWSAPWVEMGEGDGPELGDLIVTRFWGGALQGLRLQGAAKGIQRQMNLATVTTAVKI